MSQENVDHDVEGIPRAARMEGSYRGHEGVRRWWKDLFGAFPDFSIEIVEVRDVGDLTLAAGILRGHGAGSDTPTEAAIWQVSRWRRSKCVWWRTFDTHAEALEAAGLSE